MYQLYADLDFVGQLKLDPGEQTFPFKGITYDWVCSVVSKESMAAITVNCHVSDRQSSVNAGSLLYCDAVDRFTVDSVDFQCIER